MGRGEEEGGEGGEVEGHAFHRETRCVCVCQREQKLVVLYLAFRVQPICKNWREGEREGGRGGRWGCL